MNATSVLVYVEMHQEPDFLWLMLVESRRVIRRYSRIGPLCNRAIDRHGPQSLRVNHWCGWPVHPVTPGMAVRDCAAQSDAGEYALPRVAFSYQLPRLGDAQLA
jgi:hypothetical protein